MAEETGEISTRHFIHQQAAPIRFQSTTYAPDKGGDGKPRFAVEVMVYISGVGLDYVDPMNHGNELMKAFRNYVRMKELFGYRHLGLSSTELTEMMDRLWQK